MGQPDEQDVTLGEVYRLCERIEGKVDKTNGRVTALEVAQAEQRAKTRNLEAEVFRRRSADRQAHATTDEEEAGITRRDAYMFAAGAAALGAAVVAIWKLLPFLQAVKP